MSVTPHPDTNPAEKRGNARRDPPANPPVAMLQTQHFLDLRLAVTQPFVEEIAGGGYRIDFHYSGDPPKNGGSGKSGGGRSPFKGNRDSGLSARLLDAIDNGRVSSGTDWATINACNVIDFDSRVTMALRLSENVEGPIVGRRRGRARLTEVRRHDNTPYFEDKSDTKVAAQWKEGLDTGAWLPLTVSAWFEVPIFGFLDEQTELYEQARELSNTLFIGRGKAIFSKAAFGAVDSIELGLHRIVEDYTKGGNP